METRENKNKIKYLLLNIYYKPLDEIKTYKFYYGALYKGQIKHLILITNKLNFKMLKCERFEDTLIINMITK